MTDKKRNILMSLFALAVSLSLVVPAFAAPKTKADHTTLADKYEKMASEQESVVKEHTEMKKDYRADQASLPKQTREKSLAEMEKHCDAIISEAAKLASEYKAVAQWHKIRATEVEK